MERGHTLTKAPGTAKKKRGGILPRLTFRADRTAPSGPAAMPTTIVMSPTASSPPPGDEPPRKMLTAAFSEELKAPFSDSEALGEDPSSDPSRTGDGGRGGGA